MKERPILFTGEMVQAILAGRKTQTRRLIDRLQEFGPITEFGISRTPGYDWTFRNQRMLWNDVRHERLADVCPYGKPGDQFWVQEAHQILSIDSSFCGVSVRYVVDGAVADCPLTEAEAEKLKGRKRPTAVHPGRFMYRSLSRLQLDLKDIRLGLLQDITEDDAMAEGMGPGFVASWGGESSVCVGHRPMFARVWDEIYGSNPWQDNPWVWTLDFKVNEPAQSIGGVA